MEEYTNSDAYFYDYFATGLDGDCTFYFEQAKKYGSPILELGCGTGRILIPIAQAGINIVGLDRSEAMLSIAKQKISILSPEVQNNIELIKGDMRNFSINKKFNLVIIPYRSFLYLLTPEDQKSTLKCIHKHLVDNGKLIFNIFDPDLEIITEHFSSLGSCLKKQDEFINPETGNKVILWDTRQYNPENQTLDQYFIFEEINKQGFVVSKSYAPLHIRYIHRYEMQFLLELCGYKIDALYGDFQGGPYQYGGEQIWIASKN